MINTIIHTTDSNNSYIYDYFNRLSMLIHPEFEKVYQKNSNVDLYYLKKYDYLKEHGFFSNHVPDNFGILDEKMVENSIVQTRQIVFETTDSCNLNCTYCALGDLYRGYDLREKKNINESSAIKLLKYIVDLKYKNKNNKLTIGFYGGEPLINIQFIKKIVEITKQMKFETGINFDYAMTSNGTLIHKCFRFLVENNFKLLISLDGNEENHSYRFFKKNRKNSFQKVTENLDMIQRKYPEYFSSQVNFNAVLHNRNSVKEIYEFIYYRYKKIPRIAELNLRDIKQENKEILKSIFNNRRKSEVEFQKEESELFNLTHNESFAYRELTDFLKHFSVNYYVSNLNSLFQDSEKYLPTCTCIPFSLRIFLTNNNKLLPCEKINYNNSFGRISENVEIDISDVTRQYNFYFDHIKKFCENCYVYRFCSVCIFHLSYIDKIDSQEFVCDNFHGQNAFKDKLFFIFSYFEKNPKDFPNIIENHMII